VELEGLLSAKVTEKWYWEPYEWEGMNEPVRGHGEKLVMYRVGTSGANATTQDISWQREPWTRVATRVQGCLVHVLQRRDHEVIRQLHASPVVGAIHWPALVPHGI
jgi:hypothetical protein